VLDAFLTWRLATRLPWLLPGPALHRAGLQAAAAGASRAADALFEHAAARYRLDLEVEALARLRVHQMIVRVRASADPRRDGATCLEIEQRLTRLRRIEALEPPFALVPSSRLLASWMAESRPSSPESPPLASAGPLPDAA
jgi:hypothetical protein